MLVRHILFCCRSRYRTWPRPRVVCTESHGNYRSLLALPSPSSLLRTRHNIGLQPQRDRPHALWPTNFPRHLPKYTRLRSQLCPAEEPDANVRRQDVLPPPLSIVHRRFSPLHKLVYQLPHSSSAHLCLALSSKPLASWLIAQDRHRRAMCIEASEFQSQLPRALSYEFLDWPLCDTKKAKRFRALHVSFHDSAALEHILTAHGLKLQFLLLSMLRASEVSVLAKYCPATESLNIEWSVSFWPRKEVALKDIALCE